MEEEEGANPQFSIPSDNLASVQENNSQIASP